MEEAIYLGMEMAIGCPAAQHLPLIFPLILQLFWLNSRVPSLIYGCVYWREHELR